MNTTATAGGETTGAYHALNEIEFFGVAGDPLTLEVNTSTGAVAIKNVTADSSDMNFYTLSSSSGALNPGGWDSLDSQNIDATDGDDPGSVAGDSLLEGWDEAASDNLTANILTEAFLLGHSTLDQGDRVEIGNAYNPQAGSEDLEFNYGLSSGSFRSGMIEYVSGGVILGDVNLDRVVNGLDVDPFVGVLLNGPFQAEADMNRGRRGQRPGRRSVRGRRGRRWCPGGPRTVDPRPGRSGRPGHGVTNLKRRSSDATFLAPVTLGRWSAGCAYRQHSAADSTLDRAYLFGDSTGISAQNENATAGQKIGSGAGGVTFDTVSESNNPGNDSDAQNLSPTCDGRAEICVRRPRAVPADGGRRRSDPAGGR